MKKQHILIFLIAVCAQLSAFASVLEKETLVKGTAKLNGTDIPIWFNITGESTAEVGNGKNAAISQYAAGKLIIPASFTNATENRQYKVTKVGDFAFSLCDKLTEVVLEEGITEIGEQTFFGCNALLTIGYPASLTTIGRGAFRGCRNLKHTNLPENLATIGQETFAENQFADNKIVIPNKITTIPLASFEGSKLQIVVLPPSLTSIEEDAFLHSEDCDFYMFDGKTAPTVNEKSVNLKGHWYATNPEIYTADNFCKGLLPVSAMLPQKEFIAEGITYKVLKEGTYPGIFTASVHKKSDETTWSHTFAELKENVFNNSFAGKWKPTFRVNGITPDFFAGEGIEKLHHIALPANIEAAQAKNAFAQCKALVSLDLSKLKPLAKNESDELLSNLPENTVVYAPKGQTEAHRAYNTVLTTDNGERRTSHFKMNIDDNFNELAMKGNMKYDLPHKFMADKATFYRSSFQNKKKETLVLPFTAKPSGKAYAFDKMQGENGAEQTILFSKEEQMQANKPYIYVSDGEVISGDNVEINPQTAETTPSEATNLYGVYEADFIKNIAKNLQLQGTIYVYSSAGNTGKGAFVRAGETAKITPFHAFFHLNRNNSETKLNVSFEGEEPTEIDTPSASNSNDNNAWFNLQGIKLNGKPKKGIYIHNGKKKII
ncbi:leucine-rich repeat domain-containing protein [Prevotella falsenii]|uniref:leucine-rich repeat domain-containing protein n=1 Tax=Prevotella falsenii TaxID=515414 RepID=UPI00046AEBAE|nr:leucine-rich repeat domain-containing protein [Prevotella falsenii]